MNASAGQVILPGHVQRSGWGPALVSLGLGLTLMGFLFFEEVAAAVRIWTVSTAYNHCWLVAPIAAWLAWQRRHRLRGLVPEPMPGAAALLLLPALAWFAAERLGIMEGRQLAVIGMVWGLVLTVLGWRIVRAMAAPLAYLIFLVPFGAFVTPLLQELTAWMIEVGLQLWGVSYWRDGMLIETRAGMFHVAEACAGLRFLIAALAFGALYAFVLFRSPGRRLFVMALSVVVPVLANGVRAFGIVVAAEYIGSAEAAAADHVIYGWGFFSVVMLLLIVAGLPFREDHRPEEAPTAHVSAARPHGLLVASVAALTLLAAGPAAAAGLNRAAGPPQEVPVASLVAPPGCEATAPATLRCDGVIITARLLVFPPRVTWAPVAGERRRAHFAGNDEDTVFTLGTAGRVVWQGREYDGGEGAGATAVWLAGRPAGGLASRVEQALAGVTGGSGRPVVAIVQARPEHETTSSSRRAGAVLRTVLEAQAEGMVPQGIVLSQSARDHAGK